MKITAYNLQCQKNKKGEKSANALATSLDPTLVSIFYKFARKKVLNYVFRYCKIDSAWSSNVHVIFNFNYIRYHWRKRVTCSGLDDDDIIPGWFFSFLFLVFDIVSL